MIISTDQPLTGSNSAAAISASLRRRVADPWRRPASPSPADLEKAPRERDASRTCGQSQRRFPVYYLGHPTQTWIDAMSGRPRVRSGTPASIGQGRPT
jgi:hypothetical protein